MAEIYAVPHWFTRHDRAIEPIPTRERTILCERTENGLVIYGFISEWCKTKKDRMFYRITPVSDFYMSNASLSLEQEGFEKHRYLWTA